MANNRLNGWNKKMLRVNLSSKTYSVEDISDDDLRLFLGGRGLGAAIMLRELKPKIQPLSPDNIMIFSTGPLVGTQVPGSNRYVLHTKSPLTGLYLFSISGGEFGSKLKNTGFDVLIVKGKSEEPTYLFIEEGKVEFKSALHLWGLDTQETQKTIQLELNNPKVGITCIGPAGENLVPYACILNEKRALGRGGAGAVMGSKNLKALVVSGGRKDFVSNTTSFKVALKKSLREIKENHLTSEALKRYGSANMLKTLKDSNVLPGENWSEVAGNEAEAITADKLREHFLLKDVACANGCPVRCSKIYQVNSGKWAGVQSEGPDYETLYAFGSCCGIYDLATIIKADSMCDQLGLDTISTGVSIAFAMECQKRGIINTDDYGMPNLLFGDTEKTIELISDIAYKKGFGAVLAQGTRNMSEKFGNGAEKFAMHAKGMELGGYDPRGIKGMALVYGCGPRGGCHHAGGYTVFPEIINPNIDRFSETGKSSLVIDTRNRRASICDSGLICAFVYAGISGETAADLLSSVTGIGYKEEDLFLIGERISQIERIFNCREGVRREDDILPERLYTEDIPTKTKESAGVIKDFESMKDEFYKFCKWDIETGVPLKEHLEVLRISWAGDYLNL